MRLLWVLPSLSGGEGTVLASWVCPLLQQAGHQVDILPLARTDYPYLFTPGTDILDIPVNARLSFGKHVGSFFKRLYGFYDRIILDQDLDMEFKAVVASGKQNRAARAVLVAHIPLTPYLFMRKDGAAALRERIRSLYPRLGRIVTVSDQVREDLTLRYGVPRTHTVAVPLPCPPLQSEIPPPPGLKDPSRPLIAAMGSLDALKSGEVLVNAVKVAQDQCGVPLRLLLVGDGPSRISVLRLARSLGVEAAVPGWVQYPETWLRAADIFVAPQSLDGAGWDGELAARCGLPVIMVKDSGTGSKPWGVTVGAGDTMGMAGALEKWVTDPRDRLDHADMARDQAGRQNGNAAWLSALTG